MLNFVFAALSVPLSIRVSATLSKSAAPSGGNVTSDTVTVTVPGGSSGVVVFKDFVFTGVVGTQYSKNGGAFTSISDGGTVTFANGDTLAVRGTGMTSGEIWSFTLQDQGRATDIGTYGINAS